jgi:glycosyltransferase involved in cell wall biosynthesis
MRRIAVIPAYNAEKTITDIVNESLRYCDMVIVVDNNSKDKTGTKAFDAGANVTGCDIQGAGAATRHGIKYALQFNPDIIVTIDSDGQHRPSEIPLVSLQVEQGFADICIGSRVLCNFDMPLYRTIGNSVINIVFNAGNYKWVKDTQSGFRAFTRNVAENVNIEQSGFGFSTEFLLKARKQGFRIGECPITCIYHNEFSQNSTMNPIKHGISVLAKTIEYRLKEGI